MTRCEEFYERWKTTPNWCEKTPGAVSQINSYLKFVEQLEPDIPQDFTFVNLPEGAARPIVSIRDPTVKDKVLDRVKTSLREKKVYQETKKNDEPDVGGLTSGDIKDIIKSVEVVEPKRKPEPMFPATQKVLADRLTLLGAKIIEWEFPHSITVEKNKKKYEINFDAYTGNIEIFEV